MFDLKVTDEQKIYAKRLVTQYNFGNRGVANGNQQEQYIGILGQTVFADLLNMIRPSGKGGFDGGFDFFINHKRVDVKTMGRTVAVKDFYVHNFIGLQKDFNVDFYVFCSYNRKKDILTICGYVSKDEFFNGKLLCLEKSTVS